MKESEKIVGEDKNEILRNAMKQVDCVLERKMIEDRLREAQKLILSALDLLKYVPFTREVSENKCNACSEKS